ncbi:MAG TPA: fumarylacetoacetate hydrolase family protein [Actinomycetota bacterium]|nr:fumarylacetoacetate hydrolase family protein [Actinomycetota bacterium]
MKLSRILREGPDGPEPRLVHVDPGAGVVVDLVTAERARLERSGASREAALRLARAVFPSSMAAAIGAGPAFTDAAARAATQADDEATFAIDGVEWTSPIDPPTMLDGSAFEQHLVNAHARGKREVPDTFYEVPVYYKMNPLTVYGHDATVPWPGGVGFMDYELELAIVIGPGGSDLLPEQAWSHVFGLTVMNDFSARDVQAAEMRSGFGPAKGKDFATSLGPWITTADEIPAGPLTMLARVNGEEWSRGSTETLTWSLDEIVAYASKGEAVVPGEVIGTGTVGLGCGLELFKKLRPGDVVELEIDAIGTLRNVVGEPGPEPWVPERKERRAEVTLPAKDDAPKDERPVAR